MQPDAIPLDYLLDLIGKPRTIDFKNVDYPNYGASLETYPWETGPAAAGNRDGGGESRLGKTQAGQRRGVWVSRRIRAF